MKLNELILKGRDRYDYGDVRNELAWWKDVKYDKIVDAGIPGIKLGIKKNFAPGLTRGEMNDYKYSVIILDNETPVGFVFFKKPERFMSSKQMPTDTYTPHAGIKHAYTGKGYISAVYKWFLDAGHNLITGHEQTGASNALWRSLSRSYDLQFISNDGNVISNITPDKAQHPDTRMMLLGKGRKKLEELLKKRVPYEVLAASPAYFSTEATIGDRKVKFTADSFLGKMEHHNDWEIEFSESKPGSNRTWKATGSGKVFDVGAFVLASIQEFIDRYKPDAIYFTAENDTRASIYRRAMNQRFKEYKETRAGANGKPLGHDVIRFAK